MTESDPGPAGTGPTGSDPYWRARATEALAPISEAVCILDAEDRVTWLNSAAERLLAHPAAELLGRRVWEFPGLAGSPLEDTYRRARRTGAAEHLEFFYGPLDRWLEIRASAYLDDLVVFFHDVHERRSLDEEGAAESSLLRGVLDALPARIAILHGDGTVLTTNAAWDAVRPPPGAVAVAGGGNYLDACQTAAAAGDPEARSLCEGVQAVLDRRLPSFSLDHHWAGVEGGETWWHTQVFPVGGQRRVVLTSTDITDRISAEHRAAWQARHDHLTALPNRAALHEAIAEALAEDVGGRVTVLFMDVDGFKQVNDSLGHAAGDLLLRELASRLQHRTRPSDVVGRLGGDEFVVVARDCDAAGGERLARRFRSVFDEPFELAGSRLPVTVSIGIATSDPAHAAPDDLLRDADVAMYAAKASGPNRHLAFTPELRSALDDRWQVASRLRDAAPEGQLVLHWQPVVRLPDGTVTGCEALLRWRHPERGLLGPAQFVPLAEENGLIVPITRWLLATATAQGAAWAAQGLDLEVAVNVSAVHLASGTLVDDVLGALAGSSLDPGRLTLELTETSLADDRDGAAAQFARLRAHGVRIAIDDFGTGYSSLAALATLPADVLKVDRTLVSGTAPACATAPEAVLGAVAALGVALHLTVLAEGVETPAQLERARRVGCTHAQGHLLSPPVPADQLSALLHAWRDGRAPLSAPPSGS